MMNEKWQLTVRSTQFLAGKLASFYCLLSNGTKVIASIEVHGLGSSEVLSRLLACSVVEKVIDCSPLGVKTNNGACTTRPRA